MPTIQFCNKKGESQKKPSCNLLSSFFLRMNPDLQLVSPWHQYEEKLLQSTWQKVVSKEGFGLDLGLFTAPLVYLN